MSLKKTLATLAITGALATSAKATPSIINGEFTTNADGWSLINHSAANWQPGLGWDGEPGYFFVNDAGRKIPETSQLITDLVSGESYNISGYFRRESQNWADPNFQVLLDNESYFTAGGILGDGWTPFNFNYTACNNNALLRFQSQVTGDDAYSIDNIKITPEPSTIALLGLGATTIASSRRKRKP